MTINQEKKTGQGTTYSLAGQLIGGVEGITPATISVDKIEATDLDASIKLFLAGRPKDVGEVTLDLFWTPGATFDELIDTNINASPSTTATHVIVFNSLATVKTATFSGWFMSSAPSRVDGKSPFKRTVVIVLTTVITWT